MEVPEKYRKFYALAVAGDSARAASQVYCLMCVGWDPAEVRACSAHDCPLYPYRLSKDQKYAQKRLSQSFDGAPVASVQPDGSTHPGNRNTASETTLSVVSGSPGGDGETP